MLLPSRDPRKADRFTHEILTHPASNGKHRRPFALVEAQFALSYKLRRRRDGEGRPVVCAGVSRQIEGRDRRELSDTLDSDEHGAPGRGECEFSPRDARIRLRRRDRDLHEPRRTPGLHRYRFGFALPYPAFPNRLPRALIIYACEFDQSRRLRSESTCRPAPTSGGVPAATACRATHDLKKVIGFRL